MKSWKSRQHFSQLYDLQGHARTDDGMANGTTASRQIEFTFSEWSQILFEKWITTQSGISVWVLCAVEASRHNAFEFALNEINGWHCTIELTHVTSSHTRLQLQCWVHRIYSPLLIGSACSHMATDAQTVICWCHWSREYFTGFISLHVALRLQLNLHFRRLVFHSLSSLFSISAISFYSRRILSIMKSVLLLVCNIDRYRFWKVVRLRTWWCNFEN